MAAQNFPGLSNKEAIILEMLAERGEMFGLAMADASAGELKRGTIYVTLQRMSEKGLVNSREEARAAGEIGIARRIYKITALGERLLKARQLALKYLSLNWDA